MGDAWHIGVKKFEGKFERQQNTFLLTGVKWPEREERLGKLIVPKKQ